MNTIEVVFMELYRWIACIPMNHLGACVCHRSVCVTPSGSNGSIKNLTFTTTAKKLGWKLCYHKLVKLSSHHLKVAIGVWQGWCLIFLLKFYLNFCEVLPVCDVCGSESPLLVSNHTWYFFRTVLDSCSIMAGLYRCLQITSPHRRNSSLSNFYQKFRAGQLNWGDFNFSDWSHDISFPFLKLPLGSFNVELI